MKVLFLPLYNDIWASSRCRIYLYKKRLEKHSISVHILPPPNPDIISRGIYLCKIFFSLLWVDVVYIQKKIFPSYLFFIIKTFNNRIVFDFDDAIHACPSSIDTHLFDTRSNERQLSNILKRCSHIVVGNSYLYQFAMKHNSHTTIIPTPVDHEQFSPQQPEGLNSQSEKGKRKIVLGWVGQGQNLIYLDTVKDALQEISHLRRNRICLKVISNKPYCIEGVDVLNQTWSIEKEVDNLRSIDIGLMPLIDDEWTHGICSFKALQFMCLGLPVVISPVGNNKEVVSHGKNGYFANTKEEWIRYLLNLIDDEEKRKEFGFAGREFVITKYTYEVTTPMLVKVLRETVCN
ncbi:MAG: glycosyltransferase family 4 protein [Candidatus Scalindua sp.]|nr:glycosyltransferase family 4 protein [Candidatus Scalindua sp.]MBT5305063.1 glycosyltransferase family 4 protein [Candidatus Scalindua sp.]MBT6048058.1 glycosyltransferase family 4 protein [Candidatus Scalindua sp.]MBT6228727.1 glycosyltransferase family 4 protein [Candidatus Scalindua sp.]MBT7210641.1 glycosyltransferase family 4 protein [Candidatus Scalindua sp.]